MIIDISQHQGIIDWEKVKPFIEGAIIRCGYGSNLKKQDDKQWERNSSECERLEIPYGVYLYSYASNTDEAKSECDHIKRLVAGKKYSLPIFYDLEESKLKTFARSSWEIFQNEMKGYNIGVYSGESYYNSNLQNISSPYYWIAKYGKNNGQQNTKPKLKDGNVINLWQYCSKGVTIPGIISSGLDCNVILNIGKTEEKTSDDFIVGSNYRCLCGLQVRRGPGLNYGRKSWHELTTNGRKCDKDRNGCFDKGTIITCQAISSDSKGNTFILCPSGWIRGKSSSGELYLKRV